MSSENSEYVENLLKTADTRIPRPENAVAYSVISSSAINKIIEIAKNEVGYLEKRSNSQLDSKTGNAGTNNYTKYWRDIYPSYQGQPWCACFVTWVYVQAFGVDMAKKLLKHYPYVYCPTMANLFTLYANPEPGDIVIFKRNGTFTHTGIVTYVNGDYFETVEGNTSGGSTIVENGGGVFEKSYYNSNLPGTKFCRPDYSLVEEELTMAQYEELTSKIDSLNSEISTLKSQISNLENETTKVKDAFGGTFIYNYIDSNMPDWAHEPVKWCVSNGIIQGTNENGDLGLNNMKLWVCVVLYRLAKLLGK